MKLLSKTITFQDNIEIAKNLTGEFHKEVIFHCFWNGILNEKHYISILSCFVMNVENYPNRKIYLWSDENFLQNEWYEKIKLICEIKLFIYVDEIKGSFFEVHKPKSLNSNYSYQTDLIRYILLYKHTGVWFDLDILFLRDVSPLLKNYENEICVYNWAEQPHPNGAYFQNLQDSNKKFEDFVKTMIYVGRGFGFQESFLKFETPVDLLVLPASWFDPCFCLDFTEPFGKLQNGGPDLKYFFKKTAKEVTLKNFSDGSFCYHWHNMWYEEYETGSFYDQLKNELLEIKK